MNPHSGRRDDVTLWVWSHLARHAVSRGGARHKDTYRGKNKNRGDCANRFLHNHVLRVRQNVKRRRRRLKAAPPVLGKLSGWRQSGEQSHAGRSQPLLAIYSRWREAGGASEEGAALSISATSSPEIRPERPAACGRNTLCTLMPLGCKVLPFSI